MTKLLTLALMACMSLSTIAAKVELRKRTMIYMVESRNSLSEFVSFPAGTILKVSKNTLVESGRYWVDTANGERKQWVDSLVRVRAVVNDWDLSGSRYRRAQDINSGYYDFAVKRSVLNSTHRTTPVRPGNRVIRSRDELTTFDTVSYNRCYVEPQAVWSVRNQSQYDEGRRARNTGLGIIGGAIIGGLLGADEDAVRLFAGFGALVGFIGAVQMDSASEFRVLDTETCRRHFRVQRTKRRHVRGEWCTTTHYVSNSWGGSHSYVETNCSSRRFISYDVSGSW